jgi:protocadherin-15
VEVRVTPGPNLRGPIFDQFLYETDVSEGAAKFSSVVTTSARDPEGGPVAYSISGGNEEGHFQVEESTGVVRVMEPLDRENIIRYSLTVRAEDIGGKYSTATINVVVTDINDSNPKFENEPYSFRVREGESGADVGRVEASDGDSGDNANMFYTVPESSPFAIDAIGGQIRTKSNLDFESQAVHYVVVTARDGGREPRISTATVTVLVQDTADEVPKFNTELYEATVPENAANFVVAIVQAEDLDTDTSITYRLVSGDLDKFTVDPVSGAVKTIRGLDFERERTHELVIGTEEGRMLGSNLAGSTCRVAVTVGDVNDVPPMFTRTPRGNVIDVRNDAEVGNKIGTVAAEDSDGAEPGNIVRYTITESGSSERSTKYFSIGEESGEIEITDDLTKELYDEYRVSAVNISLHRRNHHPDSVASSSKGFDCRA